MSFRGKGRRAGLGLQTTIIPIPLTDLVIHDDIDTVLPETAAADDLGITEGTFKTSAPLLTTIDFDGSGTPSTIAYGRFFIPVPALWNGAGMKLRVNALVSATPAVNSVVDLEVVTLAAPTTDLCETAEQDLTTTAADYDFILTDSSIVEGDVLDCRIKADGDDTAGTGAIVIQINSIELILSV